MPKNDQFLLGSVFERKPSGPALPPKPTSASSHGFPAVQHRSKSAFARSRENAQKPTSVTKEIRPQAPPIVASAQLDSTKSEKPVHDDWREQLSRENETRVANMTDEEREAEKKDILERFGAGIGDVLERARRAREAGVAKDRWTTQKPRVQPPPSDGDSEESLKDLLEGGWFLE